MGKKKQRQLQAEATAAAERQTAIAQKMEREARARVDAQRAEYEAFRFENPYATAQNYFAGLENQFEDIGVSTAAADFQMEQGAQQRANIMQQFRGAAGGSGIAGLAQALAQQGTLQARQVSVDISQQQRQGQMMSAQAGMQLQQMAAQGATQRDMMRMQGGQMVQQAEFGRQATLLGIEYGGMAGANAAVQAAYANQMSGFGMQSGMYNAQLGMTGQIISGGLQGLGNLSDRKLKKNINKIGKSPSGLNIYSFEFKNSKYGEGLFQGVMSDEVPQEVVGTRDGYDTVDYSMLDVEFKQI